MRGHISVSTYFRLCLDKLMPTNVSRAIYLDSDILIRGSLRELWAVDLGENVLAAVSDPLANRD
jgi:UDP-glucose:(galactosyl)LPS alpha-1,2-glucosyltransferase